MSSTYRIVVKYGIPAGRAPKDPETYWLGPEEGVQLVDAVIGHQEESVEGIRLAEIVITRFGGDAALKRERLFTETGY